MAGCCRDFFITTGCGCMCVGVIVCMGLGFMMGFILR